MILGDGVINNIIRKQHQQLITQVKKVLKPTGRCVFREGIAIPAEKLLLIKEIVKNYRRDQEHWFELYWDILCHCYDRNKWYDLPSRLSNLGKMYEVVEEYYRQGIINEQEFNNLIKIKSELTHTFLFLEEYEHLFKQDFELLPVEQAKDFRFTKDSMIFFYGKVKK